MRIDRWVLVVSLLAATPAFADVKDDLGKAYEAAEKSMWLKPRTSGITGLKKAGDLAMACGNAIDKAVKAGEVKGTDIIVLGNFGKDAGATTNKDGKWEGMVKAARDRCVAIWIEVQRQWVSEYVESAQEQIGLIKHSPHAYTAELAAETLASCYAEVGWGYKAKLTADTTLDIHRMELTLGEAQAKVCDVLDAAIKEIDAARAKAWEEKMAPYRGVLAAGQMEVFESWYPSDWYGKKGASLSPPEALKNARTWYKVVTWDGDDGWRHWELRKISFDKKGNPVGDELETVGTGTGDWPPTKLFK